MNLSDTLKRSGWYSPPYHPSVVFKLVDVTLVQAFETLETPSCGQIPAILIRVDGVTHTLGFDGRWQDPARERDAEVERIMAAIDARGTGKA